VQEHNRGHDTNAYVYRRRPVELVWFTFFSEPKNAIQLEKQLKGWSRAKKQALIDGRFEALPSLAKKQFK
jgi:putative endonuclease